MQLGGMGFLHYNCSIADQVKMLAAVKAHVPGCDPTVMTVAPDATVDAVKSRVRASLLAVGKGSQSHVLAVKLLTCNSSQMAANAVVMKDRQFVGLIKSKSLGMCTRTEQAEKVMTPCAPPLASTTGTVVHIQLQDDSLCAGRVRCPR
jgi:hypothetical protein